MEDYLDVLTKDEYELKIEEEINRRLYEKKYISYETYISANEYFLKEVVKRG